MPIKPYIPWIAAALGIFLVALAIPQGDEDSETDGPTLPGHARNRDRIRRTVKTFSQLVDEKEEHPLRDVNRPGLAIDIEIDPGTFDLMQFVGNRTTYKKRSTDIAIRFADRGPRAATLSLRGGNSLNMPGKPNFDIKLLAGEEFAKGVKLRRFYLMNMKADVHQVKMVTGYRVLRELGLFPLYYQFVAVSVNGQPLGMFLLVEPPITGIQRANDGCIAIHRRFRHNSFNTDWNRAVPSASASLHDLETLSIRTRLDRPVEELSEVVDLHGLFTWLSVNTALRNPDTTDELFLFEVRAGTDIPQPLRLMGWDYDDIFWLRSKRDTLDDPLIFSTYGDLENQVHKHPELYERFRARLRELLATNLHPDRLVATLRDVAKERDALDDGFDPATQAAQRAARAAFVVESEKVLRDRHLELMQVLEKPDR